MRLIPLCAVALLLAGCAESSLTQSGGFAGSGAASSSRPKSVVVSDFVIAPEVLVVDRGFTARLERKIGAFPTHERKPRTIERVNDEIVATIVATLRENGLEALPGSEEGLSLSNTTLLVTGTLRPSDAAAKKNEYGIGDGKSGVVADMALSSFGGLGKRQLLAFTAEPAGGKLPSGKQAAAYNSLIAEALASNKAAPEKLSPDVEAAARRIGRGAADKIVAYGKSQGWFEGGAQAPVAQVSPGIDEKPAKPAQLAAVKPQAPAASAAPRGPSRAARNPAPAPEMIPDIATESDTASPAGD